MEQSVGVLFSDARLELFDLRGRHLARLFSRPSTVRRATCARIAYICIWLRVCAYPSYPQMRVV